MRTNIVALLCGLGGALLFMVCWTLYSDHVLLRDLVFQLTHPKPQVRAPVPQEQGK